jgi:hypothetical protein
VLTNRALPGYDNSCLLAGMFVELQRVYPVSLIRALIVQISSPRRWLSILLIVHTVFRWWSPKMLQRHGFAGCNSGDGVCRLYRSNSIVGA